MNRMAWACLVVCGTSLLHPAGAQTTATPPVQQVEVTGSRLSNADADSITPVQTVTAEQIRRSGASTLSDALNKLVVNSTATSDLGGSGSFAAGSSGAGLRGLGKQATLVLLNGRRVAPYPLADYSEIFTNLDGLPFDAIERVEVLRSGGAAVYGSDAVAGVINVITRRDFSGLRLKASHQQSILSGEFGSTNASATWGRTFDGGGSLLVNAEVYTRGKLMWSQVLQHVDPALSSRSGGFGTFSSFSWPGNIVGSGPLPGCAPELVTGGLCRYNRYERFQAIPAAERANLLMTTQMPLRGGRRGFGELLLASTKTTYLNPFQPYGPAIGGYSWGNPTDNTLRSLQMRGLPATHPLNPTGQDDVDFRYRFIDGPNQEAASTLQYRALAGVEGRSGAWGREWEWELAAGVTGGRTRLAQRGWYSYSGFRELIGNDDPGQTDPQYFNRGYRIGQVNSPAVIDRLFPRYGYGGHVRQIFVDAKAETEAARLPGGPLRVLFGTDIRHERFEVDPSEALRLGDIVGNGLSASVGTRIAGALYSEALLPLSPTLDVQFAARLDKFEGSTAHISPKAALRWHAHPMLKLRATLETGFRAPNLVESAPSTKFSFDNGVADPKRCSQANALADALAAAAAALPANDTQRSILQARADIVRVNECQGSMASIVRENTALKPETATSLTFGLIFTPIKSASVSVDAWAISRRNEIGLDSSATLLANEDVLAAGTISRRGLANDRSFSAAEQIQYGVNTGALDAAIGRFENKSRTQVAGIDVTGKVTLTTPIGPLDLSVEASRSVLLRYWAAARNDWGDNLAGRSPSPRWTAVIGATLNTGRVTHSMRGNPISGRPLRGDYSDTRFTYEACASRGFSKQECRTPGYTFWDYTLEAQLPAGVTAGMHVYNVFGKRQPVAPAGWLGGNGIIPPTVEDAKGRMLRLSLEWKVW